MKQAFKNIIAGLLLSAAAVGASAAVVQLGSISKTYGTGAATASTGAGSCDTLNAGSIKVTDNNGCNRFSDVFDFHGLNYKKHRPFQPVAHFRRHQRCLRLFLPGRLECPLCR